VHELGYDACPKSYVFRGTKEYAPKAIQDVSGAACVDMAGATLADFRPPPVCSQMLALTPGARPMAPGGPSNPQQQPQRAAGQQGASRFLLPVSQCEFQLTSILEQLQKDPWPVANDKRAQRCTGTALSVAMGILETTFPNTGARVMLFCGGPATEGPGNVVSTELRERIRSHHDIDKDNVRFFKRAVKFYEAMAKRAANNGHSIDVFAGCLDQVGLLEMKSLANWTNGHMILADSFQMGIFKQSFGKIFEKDEKGDLNMGFNATLDVQVG
jgi:protein transport protein SEC23